MRTMAKILGINSRDVGEDIIAELGVIYPDGRDGDRFECQLPWEDDRVRSVIGCLAAHGFVPSSGRRRIASNEYWMQIERNYDRSDLDSASYLNLRAKVPFRSYTRSPEGLIQLDAEEVRTDADIAYASQPWTVVSGRLKDLIEREGLGRVVFRETQVVGPARLRDEYEGRFWELTSDLVLPPMSPCCKFFDAVTGEEVAGNSERPFVLREGLEAPDILYTPAEIVYDATAINTVGPFDLALTCETFGNNYSRMIVASNIFYRFCESLGLDILWSPVRINKSS
jgi:hypothetical protein